MKKEIKLFMAYAPEDEKYQIELSKHLAGLKEDGVISEISAAEVLPGADIMNDLRKRMGQSDIIALLLSSDFLGTNHGVELEEMAFAQMAKKGTRLVPIKIREVTLGRAYAQFSMLPGQNKPVDDPEWGGRDAAYANITGGIRQLAESMIEDDQPARKPVQRPRTSEPSPTQTNSASGTATNSQASGTTNPQSKMGMKIGVGLVAALLIGAAVWFMMPNEGQEPIKGLTTDTSKETTTGGGAVLDIDADGDAYRAAKNQGSIEAFETYLNDFPEGDYLMEAESNIALLKEKKYKAAAMAEWDKATTAGNIVGYSYYLQNYPNGDSVEVAKVRIQKLSTRADDNKAWERTSNINTKSSFLLYVQEYGNKGLHYNDAIDSIKGLLTSSGWSYYGAKNSDDTMQDDRYFDRLLGEKNAEPTEGDLIIVKKAIRVRSGAANTYGAITVLAPETIAEISEVSDDFWVHIKY